VDVGDGGDLAVDERCRRAHRFEARTLLSVPRRRGLVIWEDLERSPHYVAQIRFKRGSPLSFRQAAASVRELVQYGRCDGAPRTVLVKARQDRLVRLLRHG
jgi:hypothetical protein